MSVTMNRLRPFTFLPASKARVAAGTVSGSADGLRVDQARARLRVATLGFTDLVAQSVVDALDGALVAPPSEVAVHRRPRGEVLQQLPPGTLGPHHIEDRVRDSSPRMRLPPLTRRPNPRRREQQLHQHPLFTRQVRRIPPRHPR